MVSDDRLSPPARWHKALAEICGELSFCVLRRKVSLGKLRVWQSTIEKVLTEMKEMENK